MTKINLYLICLIGIFSATVSAALFNPVRTEAQPIAEAAGSFQLSSQLPAGSLAILPFVKGDFAEQFRMKNLSPLICPIDKLCLDLLEGDETIFFMEKLDKHLHKIVQRKVGANIYSMEETKKQLATIPIDLSEETTLSKAMKLAKKTKSDYVLVPILWDYSERIGSKISAEKPASVDLSVYLISAKEEKRLWKSNFSKTQKALTDNILDAKDVFKFGGKWVSAEELAQAGMETIIKDFPF